MHSPGRQVNKAAGYFRDIGPTSPDQDLLELAETLIAGGALVRAAEEALV